jgi:hypothetical protein
MEAVEPIFHYESKKDEDRERAGRPVTLDFIEPPRQLTRPGRKARFSWVSCTRLSCQLLLPMEVLPFFCCSRNGIYGCRTDPR